MKTLLLAAVAAGPVLGWGASGLAQQRVDQGRAMDANMRSGSGGFNDGVDRSINSFNATRADRTFVPGNNVVTGNVTAGRHFRGGVPYTDPRAFRGATAGVQSDAFIRQSSGVPAPGVPGTNAMTPRPFYGQSRAVAPPPGYVEQGFTGGYIPAPRIESDPTDLRLGRPINNRLPSDGLLMQVPVAEQSDPSMISASTLYGVRQWQVGDERDRSFLSSYTDLFGDRTRSGLDDQTLQRMRRELEDGEAADPTDQQPPDPLGTRTAIESPRVSAAQPAQGGSALSATAVAQQPLGSQDLATGQRSRNRLMLDAETQQRLQHSPQYAQLREARRALYGANAQMSDVEAARDFNEQMRIARELQQQDQQQAEPRRPGDPRPQAPDELVGRIPQDEQADQPQDPARPGQRPPPVRIDSFAEGIDAQGLRTLLDEAEELMKQGKWISALQKYEDASRVAPDERLIVVARAIAEIGATYYAHAETDLRRAFTRDPNLLMAQYDLRELIGEDRLQYISDDLKQIANKEQNSPRPLLLLAFIAYNTGHERSALGYIDLAEKRAGGKDEFLQLLRTHWSLPEGQAEQNK